jgi:hypothetical protein
VLRLHTGDFIPRQDSTGFAFGQLKDGKPVRDLEDRGIPAPGVRTKRGASTYQVFNPISRDEGPNGRRLPMGRKCGAKGKTKRLNSQKKGEMR